MTYNQLASAHQPIQPAQSNQPPKPLVTPTKTDIAQIIRPKQQLKPSLGLYGSLLGFTQQLSGRQGYSLRNGNKGGKTGLLRDFRERPATADFLKQVEKKERERAKAARAKQKG